ncbi:MAG: hypothetical protein ACRDIL_13975 [Candidatus Limnocylindrales bacterium]
MSSHEATQRRPRRGAPGIRQVPSATAEALDAFVERRKGEIAACE